MYTYFECKLLVHPCTPKNKGIIFLASCCFPHIAGNLVRIHSVPIKIQMFSTFHWILEALPTETCWCIKSEEKNILIFQFPRVGIESTNCDIYSRTLVPLCHAWPQLLKIFLTTKQPNVMVLLSPLSPTLYQILVVTQYRYQSEDMIIINYYIVI